MIFIAFLILAFLQSIDPTIYPPGASPYLVWGMLLALTFPLSEIALWAVFVSLVCAVYLLLKRPNGGNG